MPYIDIQVVSLKPHRLHPSVLFVFLGVEWIKILHRFYTHFKIHASECDTENVSRYFFVKDKFSPCINSFTYLVKQNESFKLELDSRNEEVILIISHDLEGVEAGQSEPENTVKRK